MSTPPLYRAGLLPALLKHWRSQRGLSQLDLALNANVSSRHVSFIETGRSTPSPEMILRLAAALDVPLRHVNTMLQAAGHPPAYPEDGPARPLPDAIVRALQLMKEHHDPFPLAVVDGAYDILDLNAGAMALFGAVFPQLAATSPARLNLMRLTFDPNGAQPLLLNFHEVGPALLWRLQREVLADPHNIPLRDLLDSILTLPTVADDWRDADLAIPSSPTLEVRLLWGTQPLSFLTTVTAFQAPQTVQLDELRIETWYPSDAATAEACRKLASA